MDQATRSAIADANSYQKCDDTGNKWSYIAIILRRNKTLVLTWLEKVLPADICCYFFVSLLHFLSFFFRFEYTITISIRHFIVSFSFLYQTFLNLRVSFWIYVCLFEFTCAFFNLRVQHKITLIGCAQRRGPKCVPLYLAIFATRGRGWSSSSSCDSNF